PADALESTVPMIRRIFRSLSVVILLALVGVDAGADNAPPSPAQPTPGRVPQLLLAPAFTTFGFGNGLFGVSPSVPGNPHSPQTLGIGFESGQPVSGTLRVRVGR